MASRNKHNLPSRPGITDTEVRVLDALVDGPLSAEELRAVVGPQLWGHHLVKTALEAGVEGTDEMALAEEGRPVAVNNAITSLLEHQPPVLRYRPADGRLEWTGVKPMRDRYGSQHPYEPGFERRQGARARLNMRVAEELSAKGGLEGLFKRTTAEINELADAIRADGFDEAFPIIVDANTGEVVDGFSRQTAAKKADVTPKVVSRHFEDRIDQVLFWVRANVRRRHIEKESRREITGMLRAMGLTGAEVADLLKVSRRTVTADSVASDNAQSGAKLDKGKRSRNGTPAEREALGNEILAWSRQNPRPPVK
jgi:hypothetical protein